MLLLTHVCVLKDTLVKHVLKQVTNCYRKDIYDGTDIDKLLYLLKAGWTLTLTLV